MVPPWVPSFMELFDCLHVGSRRAKPGSAERRRLISNDSILAPFAGMTRIRFGGCDLSRS
jgi:hypothetical protein